MTGGLIFPEIYPCPRALDIYNCPGLFPQLPVAWSSWFIFMEMLSAQLLYVDWHFTRMWQIIKYLYHFTKPDNLGPYNYLNSATFNEVTVPMQVSKQSCIWMLGYLFFPSTSIFLLKFGNVKHYVINVFSDLRQVGSFVRVLRFSPPIKLTATIWLKYCWKWR